MKDNGKDKGPAPQTLLHQADGRPGVGRTTGLSSLVAPGAQESNVGSSLKYISRCATAWLKTDWMTRKLTGLKQRNESGKKQK